uniref:hypothetical protein n=1 Tax=Spirosoma endophyticum TaxID=662367 RepID=UPI00373FCD2F
MAITYGGKRLMLNAGYRIDTAKWNEDKQRSKNNTTTAEALRLLRSTISSTRWRTASINTSKPVRLRGLLLPLLR